MGVRRPAFALIIVLLLVSSIFAMTIHSAVVLRSSIVETGAVGGRQQDLRTAQSVASLVLRGMSTGATSTGDGPDDASGGDGADGPEDEPDERLELPPIVRQLLAAAGREIEEAAEKELDRGGSRALDGAGSGDVRRGPSGLELLREVGLPVGGVVVAYEGQRCMVELADATSGININRADGPALRSYLRIKGLSDRDAERISDQIMDWRDADSVPRSEGLERDDYRPLGITPRNGPFGSIDELRMLPAVDEQVFALIRDDVCLSGDGSVHLASASAAVLRSVGGLSEAQATQLIALREQGPLEAERVQRIVDLRGEAGKRVRLEPSSVLRVRVMVRAGQETPMVFEGIAVFAGSGVTSLGLRPAG